MGKRANAKPGLQEVIKEIDLSKLPKIYPFLNDANKIFNPKNVKSIPKKKKPKSCAAQRKIYQDLLDSGEVKKSISHRSKVRGEPGLGFKSFEIDFL